VQHFVDWLTTRPDRDGRLCDRSIANALTPLRLALDAALAAGLLDATLPSTLCCRGNGRTGLRICEALGLHWSDLVLDSKTPHLQVRRAIVKAPLVAR
jgi:integrase